MTEPTITVSNGEEFYRIPVSDLGEACQDGFYLPLIRNRTIVSNGEELFEVPVTDLAEAEADGFADTLGSEQSLVYQLRDEGHVATTVLPYPSREAVVGVAVVEHERVPSAVEQSTIDSETTGDDTVDQGDPHSIFDEPDDSFDNEGDTIEEVVEFETTHDIDPSLFDTMAMTPPEPIEEQLTVESEDEEEPEDLPLYKKILGIGPDGGRTWGVLTMNSALHALAVLLLAMIILPAEQKEEFMTIASTVVAVETPKELETQAMDIEQPIDETDDIKASESIVDTLTDSLDPLDIDINDKALAAPEKAVLAATGTPAAKMTGEMGGRSKAGRSQLLKKMGGTAASESAVHEALNWMARHQRPDGGWSYDHAAGTQCDCSSPGNLANKSRNAATGMAILAMLGAGNTPFDGNFIPEVDRGVQFLIRNGRAVPAGVDLRGEGGRMYTHAIATTALCEVLAMIEAEYKRDKGDRSKRPLNIRRKKTAVQLQPICQGAINFIVNAQYKQDGGWGYVPGTAGDTSILGWQVMALKSAKHAHVTFPASTIVAANRFLNKVQDSDGKYGYRDAKSKKASTTAIGIVCRMLSGMSRSNKLMQHGVNYLSATGPAKNNMYSNYYATQVMLNYGGDTWKKWNDVMRDQLVNSQIKSGHAAGSWDVACAHAGSGGRLYMTALCCMTLEVYYRHLPLYGDQSYYDSEVAEADPKSKSSRSRKKRNGGDKKKGNEETQKEDAAAKKTDATSADRKAEKE